MQGLFLTMKLRNLNRGSPLNNSIDQPHHMRFACEMRLFFFSKKKTLFFYFIYNFYFENLIYKYIKQFENQQESSPIFQGMFQWELELYFYRIVLQFYLYLNIGMQRHFRIIKMRNLNRRCPLNSDQPHHTRIVCAIRLFFQQKKKNSVFLLYIYIILILRI